MHLFQAQLVSLFDTAVMTGNKDEVAKALQAAAASDANGAKILVGSYKIKEGETEWVEVVRCFRADDDTDDWPDDVLVSAEA